MEKNIKELLDKTTRLHTQYEEVLEKLDSAVKEVCEFEGGITWAAGDGFIVIDKNTHFVAVLDCFEGKTKDNKLTQSQLFKYVI